MSKPIRNPNNNRPAYYDNPAQVNPPRNYNPRPVMNVRPTARPPTGAILAGVRRKVLLDC